MSIWTRHAPQLLWGLRAGLTLVAIVWLVRFVIDNAAGFLAASTQIDGQTLAIAAGAAILGLIPGAWAWQRLLARDMPDLGTIRGILVYLRSGIGKYTPGGALAFAIQHRALNDARAGPLCLLRVFIGTALAACFAAALLGLPALASFLALPVAPASLAIAIPVALFLLWAASRPAWPLFPKMLDRLGMPAPRDFVVTVIIMAFAWTVTGLHLVAFGTVLDADPLFLLSAFALSAIIGIVFSVLPGALGIRDGALAVILTNQLAPVDAMAIALLSRALIVGADVLGSAFAALLLLRRGPFPLSNRKAATR